MNILTLLLFLITTPEPNWETGEGCWRYGIDEHNNTGRMIDIPIAEIPVVDLDSGALAKICRNDSFYLNGCATAKAIYLGPDATADTRIHEDCHLVLGRKHTY